MILWVFFELSTNYKTLQYKCVCISWKIDKVTTIICVAVQAPAMFKVPFVPTKGKVCVFGSFPSRRVVLGRKCSPSFSAKLCFVIGFSHATDVLVSAPAVSHSAYNLYSSGRRMETVLLLLFSII